MRRPSASVFSTSMVKPCMERTTSPGLVARPLGMFSQAATMPTTLTGARIEASASSVPKTLAAPPMSNFISSMAAPGFRLMPPVSKVMPLPTRATGATPERPPWYSMTMNLSGSSEPRATDRNEPIFSLRTSVSPRIFTRKPLWRRARSLAVFAKCVGVQTLPGRLARLRVSATPAPMAAPSSRPRMAPLRSPFSATARPRRESFAGAGFLADLRSLTR